MRTSFIALAAAAALVTGVAQAESASYTIDPTHTFVTFEINHFGASVNRGRFDKKEGTVQFDRAGKAGKVEISFDATSINSGTPAFDKHLQSADLFNAAQHPKSPLCPTSSASTATRSAKSAASSRCWAKPAL